MRKSNTSLSSSISRVGEHQDKLWDEQILIWLLKCTKMTKFWLTCWSNIWKLEKKFLKYFPSKRIHVTIRNGARWRKSVRTTSSTDWASKPMNSVGCSRVRVNVKHKFEHKHIVNWFIYCYDRLNEALNSLITNEANSGVHIFVDEKWFNKMNVGGYMWLPGNVSIEEAAEFWRRESHIRGLIYFTAIAMLQEK